MNWEGDARFVVTAFRIEVARAGLPPEAAALAEELQAASAEFRGLWAENELPSAGMGRKCIRHAMAGSLTREYSAPSADGASGLGLVVYGGATPSDARAIEQLLSGEAS